MKPTLLSLLIFISFVLLSTKNAYAAKLEGEWTDDSGILMRAEQTGNNFSFIITDPNVPQKYQGIENLRGTISGSTFTGEAFIIAKECPNLNGHKPAKGTITKNKIEFQFVVMWYDSDACTEDPGTETEVTDYFTKILSPEERALEDYQKEIDRFGQDLSNRSGPVVDLSKAEIVAIQSIDKKIEEYPVYVAGPEYAQYQADIMNLITNQPNVSVPNLNTEIARVSNLEGDIIRHRTIDGKTTDYQINRVGTSIKGNVLNAGDTFSLNGEGFIEYISIDGSARRLMTAGYAKKHGYGDQIQSSQTGLEIILKPAEPIIPLPPKKSPGPIEKFFKWIGELLTPEPQPTPYGIVGVKG